MGFSATLMLSVLSALSSTGMVRPSCERLLIYQSACRPVVASAIYSDSVVEE